MATSCSDSVIPSASKHTCLQCGSSFSTLRFLRLHEAAHGGFYAFRCEICGKGSLSSSNLRRHMTTHSDKTEHKCTLCNRSFRYISSLLLHTHEAAHRGDYPYRCDIGGKGSFTTSNLKQHMSTHAGVRDYTCSDCMQECTRARKKNSRRVPTESLSSLVG